LNWPNVYLIDTAHGIKRNEMNLLSGKWRHLTLCTGVFKNSSLWSSDISRLLSVQIMKCTMNYYQSEEILTSQVLWTGKFEKHCCAAVKWIEK
jgi:hypothetical protein